MVHNISHGVKEKAEIIVVDIGCFANDALSH